MTRVWLEIDDPANRLTLRAILVADGCEIVSENAQAIFTDRLSTSIAYTRGLPAILVTTAGDVPLAVQAMRRGAFGYILLPMRPGEAAIALQRALEWGNSAQRLDDNSADSLSDSMRIEDAEARTILAVLRQCKNNQSKAAGVLGIGRNTLWRKLKRIRQQK